MGGNEGAGVTKVPEMVCFLLHRCSAQPVKSPSPDHRPPAVGPRLSRWWATDPSPPVCGPLFSDRDGQRQAEAAWGISRCCPNWLGRCPSVGGPSRGPPLARPRPTKTLKHPPYPPTCAFTASQHPTHPLPARTSQTPKHIPDWRPLAKTCCSDLSWVL